ncbi:fimbria/pilus periplasmic chaperone [Klebsiella aerogenes]|uniref:fimbrial biogenesis chaperone n=1 Tax=Klebsiella aerogenes TaxID=548 RepID=UPI002DBABDE5|nr:fimbria/pilus periplasmic chaperone [Klebsiella aerogenes]MEB5742662.1 fimbria/pilus periplasmic chaperone [Klebsiella aerogenes]
MSYCKLFQIVRLVSFISLISAMNAHASIVITGTRVLYPANDKEVTVQVSNKGSSPVLIQSWIDDGDTQTSPDKIHVPFILTPPINRVEPSSGQTLRIRATANTLPTDRESVFWLNVLEIPATPKEEKQKGVNYIQVAFRNRIKLFWRPEGLKDTAGAAAKKLIWSRSGSKLHVKNPTPYFVSLASINVGGDTIDGNMLAPFSDDDYKLSPRSGSNLSFLFVNDYGALVKVDNVIK